MKRWVRTAGTLARRSFKGFSEYKIPKLSASLAYYAVFSLGPLLVVIIFISGLVFDTATVQNAVYAQLEAFLGKDTASQVEQVVRNASVNGKGITAATIGFLSLLLGAGTVFGEIQDSINHIWDLRVKPKRGWLRLLKNRLLSFGMIGSLGFLLLISLAVSALIEAMNTRLEKIFPGTTVIIFYCINLLVTFCTSSLLFAIIYKVLPDAKIRWKAVWPGAMITALLFLTGKSAISFYIGRTHTGSVFGAAGSLVVLLVWIYYSSFILYFGALFTRNYAVLQGGPIEPGQYAVTTKKVETGKEKVGLTGEKN